MEYSWEIPPDVEVGLEYWQAEWNRGRDGRENAYAIAKELVERYPPALLAMLEDKTEPQLVKIIDACRGEEPWRDGVQAMFPERVPIVSCYIMSKFPPQEIHGVSALGGAHGLTPQMLRAMADAIERRERRRAAQDRAQGRA